MTEYMTLPQVADALSDRGLDTFGGISEEQKKRKVRQLIAAHEVPFTKIGRSVYMTETGIMLLLEKMTCHSTSSKSNARKTGTFAARSAGSEYSRLRKQLTKN